MNGQMRFTHVATGMVADLPGEWNQGRNNTSTEVRTRACLLYDRLAFMKNQLNVVIVVGLALGGVFGLLGSMVTSRKLQAAAWGSTVSAWWLQPPCSL